MKIDNEIQEIMNVWCTWCVNHQKFVPFVEWTRYTHGAVELDALLRFYKMGPYTEKVT